MKRLIWYGLAVIATLIASFLLPHLDLLPAILAGAALCLLVGHVLTADVHRASRRSGVRLATHAGGSSFWLGSVFAFSPRMLAHGLAKGCGRLCG